MGLLSNGFKLDLKSPYSSNEGLKTGNEAVLN